MLTELHNQGSHKIIITTPTDELDGEQGGLMVLTYPKVLGDHVVVSIRDGEPSVTVNDTNQTLTSNRAEANLMLPLDEFKQLVNALETTLTQIEETS